MLDMVLGCPLVFPILRMMKAFRILDDLHCPEHCFIGDPAPSRVARGTIIAAPPLWTSATLSPSPSVLQRAIFILAGMNFLYTISWKREEEGELERRMRRAFSSLPARSAIWTFWRHDAGVWNAAAVALSQLEG